MQESDTVINVVVAGLGGQGVIKASDIVADAAFRAGLDVKKSEIHGMSQRGGSVTSDVRFGRKVLSPMVPPGQADFLVVLSADQVENNRHVLKPGGVLIEPALIEATKLMNAKSMNVALVGALSRFLKIEANTWIEALKGNLAEKLHAANLQAFVLGREAAERMGVEVGS